MYAAASQTCICSRLSYVTSLFSFFSSSLTDVHHVMCHSGANQRHRNILLEQCHSSRSGPIVPSQAQKVLDVCQTGWWTTVMRVSVSPVFPSSCSNPSDLEQAGREAKQKEVEAGRVDASLGIFPHSSEPVSEREGSGGRGQVPRVWGSPLVYSSLLFPLWHETSFPLLSTPTA